MKKELITYIVLNVLCIVGVIIGKFIGGVLFGLGISLIVVVTLGKWQLRKATNRMDAIQNNYFKTKNQENATI